MATDVSSVVADTTKTDASATQSSGQTQAATAGTPIRVGGKEYASWDEVGKAYDKLQSEYGKWTQKYGDLEKQYQAIEQEARRWNEWWKTVQPLWGEDVEQLLRQKLMGRAPSRTAAAAATQVAQPAGQPGQPQGTQANPFEGLELLSPQEQFMKFRELLYRELIPALQQQFLGVAHGVQQLLQDKEKYYQTYLGNHLALMRKAFERKLKDPNFDVDAVMTQALEAMSGRVDPLDLGQQLISAADMEAKIEEAKKAAYEQGKKDLEQELKNKKLEAAPVVSSSPTYRVPGVGKDNNKTGLGTLRERAAKSIVEKFGPGWFTG